MLDNDQLKRVRVLVTPAAWAAHEALPAEQKLDPNDAYDVYGDLRLVAAGILRTVCLSAQQTSAQASDQRVKKFKVEGEYEEEYFNSSDVPATLAAAWCQEAERLERAARQFGFPAPVFAELQ